MQELYFEEFISFAALFFIYEHLKPPASAYFEEFISFAALFFIYEHLKPPASAFHDFNKE
jgi:hypothetical protein